MFNLREEFPNHKPLALAFDSRNVMWEIISYPFVNKEGFTVINVRQPNDPTTLIEVRARAIFPLSKEGQAEAARVLRTELGWRACPPPENTSRRAVTLEPSHTAQDEIEKSDRFWAAYKWDSLVNG